jgi:hypothetical protein
MPYCPASLRLFLKGFLNMIMKVSTMKLITQITSGEYMKIKLIMGVSNSYLITFFVKNTVKPGKTQEYLFIS